MLRQTIPAVSPQGSASDTWQCLWPRCCTPDGLPDHTVTHLVRVSAATANWHCQPGIDDSVSFSASCNDATTLPAATQLGAECVFLSDRSLLPVNYSIATLAIAPTPYLLCLLLYHSTALSPAIPQHGSISCYTTALLYLLLYHSTAPSPAIPQHCSISCYTTALLYLLLYHSTALSPAIPQHCSISCYTTAHHNKSD